MLGEAIRDGARRADLNLRPLVRETPLLPSNYLDRVHHKTEMLQRTGSFKLRGALNKLLSLSAETRARGVVTASTGNHGAGVAFAAASLGIPSQVFVPESVSDSKVARILSSGGTIVRVPGDPVRAEEAARDHALNESLPYISPYNDPEVIAGQATVGVELVRQSESQPQAVFVPLGGGGLISGIALVLKQAWPETQIVACSPVNSSAMATAIQAGRVIDVESLPTLSDGTAGGVEKDTITFDLCSALIDEFVLVTEDEIASALLTTVEWESFVIEGAAATAVAAYEKMGNSYTEDVIVVLTGGNISRETLLAVLSGDRPQPEEFRASSGKQI